VFYWYLFDRGAECEVDRLCLLVESSWNMMAHGDAREGKWRGNWRMEWVTSTLHTTSEHVVSSIATADAHISAASSRLNWRPRRFKCTRPLAERRNLVSARVPSHLKRFLLFSLNYILSVSLILTTCQVNFSHYGHLKCHCKEMQNPPFAITLTF